jgi:DNA-binding NtrC family response regulator
MPPATQFLEKTEALPKRPGGAELAFTLRVIDGPDRGKTLHVQGVDTPHLVGSSEACGLRLSDRAVSRRHFSVTINQGGLRIDDLESTNGTQVGGVRIFSAELGAEAQIRVGATTIAVEAVTPAPGAASKRGAFGRVLGASAIMRRLYPMVEDLCKVHVPVLLEGEAGTGKELLAEALHEQGARAEAPFFSCDGGDIDIDVKLFGSRTVPALLTQAEGGTVYLSNLCDLPGPTQERLLAALERRPIERADRSTLAPVDVRWIAGSRRDVDREVQRGRFSEALANAFARARVELPPLRVREGDVRLLADYFWKRLDVGDRVIAPVVMNRFENYRWPGNVRELEQAVAGLATTGDDNYDPVASFRSSDDENIGEVAERLLEADLPLIQARTVLGEEFDRRYLLKILAVHSGNVSRAAAASGIARRYFQTLKTKHGIGKG